MADQSSHGDLERVATTISAGVHVAHQLWEEVHEDERVRAVVLFAHLTLGSLYAEDPKMAGEALSKMDDARTLI